MKLSDAKQSIFLDYSRPLTTRHSMHEKCRGFREIIVTLCQLHISALSLFSFFFSVAGYEVTNDQHHKNMCSLLMTASDLSSTCKEWKWSKKVSDLIYDEFFTQGDLEVALGHTPSEMMDRNKAFVPEQQLGFLDHIAGPAYKYVVKHQRADVEYLKQLYSTNYHLAIHCKHSIHYREVSSIHRH